MLLLLLVARSKLVPDFALTVHFLHLVVTSIYTRSLPTNLLWWGLQVTSSALMVSLGIWACQWRELRPMSFGGAGAKDTTAEGEEDMNGHVEDGGWSWAFWRKERNKGVYEMVGMGEGDDHV